MKSGTANSVDHSSLLPRGISAWLNYTARSYGLDGLWREFLPLARADVLVASAILNLTALALPLVVLQVYDRIIPNFALNTLSLLVAGLMIALFLDAALNAARSYIAGWAGARFEHAAGVQAVRHILSSHLGAIEATPAGAHLDRLGSVDPVRDFYSSQASLVLIDLPFAILFVALLSVIAGSLVFIPLILIALFSVAALLVGNALRNALAERSKFDDRRFNFIIEVLSGIRTVKGLAMEALMQRRYDRLMERCAEAGYHVGYLSSLAQSIGTTFSHLTMVMVAAIGSLYVIDGDITVGALAACTLLAGRAVQPVLRALGIWTRFQSIRVAETRLAEINDMPLEAKGQAGEVEPISSIALDKATIYLGNANKPLLRDLSLKVERGEIIAVRGRNGSGKSTLLWSLMGGAAFTQGVLLINNRPVENFDINALRSQIAYLPQWPVLFEGTVLDNLTGFAGEAYHEEALRLAAILGLDDVFAKLPDGFDTMLGASATQTIAAGVSQRVAVVRALVRRPRVILFDEANTALDMDADERLKQLIIEARQEAAIVVVSHRPSLLAIADRVYEIQDNTLKKKRRSRSTARVKAPKS